MALKLLVVGRPASDRHRPPPSSVLLIDRARAGCRRWPAGELEAIRRLIVAKLCAAGAEELPVRVVVCEELADVTCSTTAFLL